VSPYTGVTNFKRPFLAHPVRVDLYIMTSYGRKQHHRKEDYGGRNEIENDGTFCYLKAV